MLFSLALMIMMMCIDLFCDEIKSVPMYGYFYGFQLINESTRKWEIIISAKRPVFWVGQFYSLSTLERL